MLQNLQVFPFGSVPLKTYLPDGDIDLTALSFPNSEDALANDVRSVLQSEEQNKGAEFEVKDVQYINAEVFHSSGILFLDYYSKFDWDNYCVSLQGPIPVSFLPELVVLLFLCYVIGNFYRIRSAFTYGARKLGRVLLLPAENIAAEVGMFFASTLERHGTGERPDVQQDASRSCSDSRFIEQNEVGSTSSNNESTLDSQVKCSSGALCDNISNIKISDLDEGYGTELQFNGHNSNKHLDGLHQCTKMENHLMGGEASVKHLDKNARDLVSIEAFNLRAAESCLDSSSHNQIGGDLSSGKAYHAPRLFFHVGNGSESVTLDNVNSGDTAKKEVVSSRFVAPGQEPNSESESHVTSTSGFKTNSVSASTGSIHGSSTTSWNSHLSEHLNTADWSCEGNGNSSSNCSKLSDLVGDFNLHYMNLLYALESQGQEYFTNQYFMPNYGLSPSQYQNKQSWNGFSQQSIYVHIRANGVIPAPPFSPHGCYPINQSLRPGVYGAKDIQKTKGTGTYFPNTVCSIFEFTAFSYFGPIHLVHHLLN
ncbi:hypothetical protein B296_00034238 [Ensete ventricosum]|uniref:PAP/OAS1 substrate-binding-related domain-containing protein n=1 Tax=Ensete ventricosum TaxID=4639 RepID=A0A427A917_ENSVE|nr:hypothetical protein B296_00034238 [Ensete ventricosum]